MLVLRAAAIVLAIVGVIDPVWSVRRDAPVPVEIREAVDGPASSAATAVKQELTAALDGSVTFASDREPAAVVRIGSTSSADASVGSGAPVSVVSLKSADNRNVRVTHVTSPSSMPVGLTASIVVSLEARGVAGQTTRVVLERQGVEVASIDHKWTSDVERFDATLLYAPPTEGAAVVRVRATPLDGETDANDNNVDVQLLSSGRRLKVLAHEPRPSWAMEFVRRVLEADEAFDVSSLVASSRGLEVRAGSAPAKLTAESLYPFDVLLIGAPEDLSAADVAALGTFVRRRGGTVVLLPDRRPSGTYLELLGGTQFEELLVNAPLAVRTASGASLRASELAVPRRDTSGIESFALAEHGKSARPVVVGYPEGAGLVIFSGALDAWRFRATDAAAFSRFWRSRVAEAALAAPPRLGLQMNPSVARPGETVSIRAQLRPTEFDDRAMPLRMPAIRASLVGSTGQQELIRLWPTAEIGAFEARIKAPVSGRYDVRVSVDDGASADDVLTVMDDAAHPVPGISPDMDQLVAKATGGIVANASDLSPLERHLRSLPKSTVDDSQHPARSPWYVVLVAGLLCSEWAIRRRRGRA
jgi:hypothetical protein